MRNIELEQSPEFGMDMFGSIDFDINAAFQEAVQGVANDDELALDEKIRRMEVIVAEGTSDVYRDFIDFRQMAGQMEMMCMHDHSMSESFNSSETLSDFLSSHKSDRHDHDEEHSSKHDDIDPKTGKKKKKKKTKYSWFKTKR